MADTNTARITKVFEVAPDKRDNRYIAELATCPECNGEGRIETMTRLTYDGAQSWHVERCDHCDGEGKSIEVVPCALCGDPIPPESLTLVNDKPAHRECVDAESEGA